MVKCENNTDKPEVSTLILAETIPGGCNTDLKSSTGDGRDTAIFTLNADTLNICVGVNYTCCTPFSSSMDFRNDSIIIVLKDICPSRNLCYCRCMCYYTWDLKITGFENSEYPYKITLDGLLAKNHPQCIEEGTVTVAQSRLLIGV